MEHHDRISINAPLNSEACFCLKLGNGSENFILGRGAGHDRDFKSGLRAQGSTTELPRYPMALHHWAIPQSHSALPLSYPMALYHWAIPISHGALPLSYPNIPWCFTTELSQSPVVLYHWATSLSHGALSLSYLAILRCSTTELPRYPTLLYHWATSLSYGALPLSYPAILTDPEEFGGITRQIRFVSYLGIIFGVVLLFPLVVACSHLPFPWVRSFLQTTAW